MNNFVLEIWDDEAGKCRFYTVRWEESSLSETDKFFEKHYAIEELKEATQQLLSFVLDSIGEDFGAVDALLFFSMEVLKQAGLLKRVGACTSSGWKPVILPIASRLH